MAAVIQAAKATAQLFVLAAVCLPVFANIPRTPLVAEKPHLGVASFALVSHRAESAANPMNAPGIAGCLYDSGPRPCCSGKERDAETGLDYFGARYFSGAQGRFTSPDPLLASGRAEQPQSWNRYAYVLNNPFRYVDPSGMQELPTSCGVGNLSCLEAESQAIARSFNADTGIGILKAAANSAIGANAIASPGLGLLHMALGSPQFEASNFDQQIGMVLGAAAETAAGIVAGGALANGSGPALNLGSGSNPMAGAINIDIRPGPGVNVIASAKQLPFRSGTFSQVHSINPYGFNPASNEAARVLQSGGNLFVTGTPRNPFMPGLQGSSSPFQNISSGPMIGAHHFGVQSLSTGRPISTLRSITEVFRKR